MRPDPPGGNLAHEFEVESGAAPGEAQGDVAIDATVSTPTDPPRRAGAASCIADCDEEGELTIWSATQSVFGARMVVAGLLGLDEERVRVIQAPMGGSFGGKQEFILKPVAAFLALSLRRPVQAGARPEPVHLASMVRRARRPPHR